MNGIGFIGANWKGNFKIGLNPIEWVLDCLLFVDLKRN